MPELSRFFGIIIRMYAEANVSHHSPHFHAYYQDSSFTKGVAKAVRELRSWVDV